MNQLITWQLEKPLKMMFSNWVLKNGIGYCTKETLSADMICSQYRNKEVVGHEGKEYVSCISVIFSMLRTLDFLIRFNQRISN